MRTLVNRIADTMVSAVVPKAEAKAIPCSWTSQYCYCQGSYLYYAYCCKPLNICQCMAKIGPVGCGYLP
jgi:hypothetical protein